MPDPTPAQRVPLTIILTADLAKRLAQQAEAQKRTAAEVVLDILDRTLPRADAKRPTIPYA